MQRQSLGSPSSTKSAAATFASDKRKSVASAAEEVDPKSDKPLILRSHASGSEFSIHIIPVLTLVCLLVLYLCSRDPSPTELVDIEAGIKRVLDRQGERWIVGAAAGGGGGGGGVSVLRVHRKLRGLSG